MKRKTIYRILIGLGIVLVLVIVTTLLYVVYARPDIPLKEVKVEITKDRVERGKYLANHVTVCMDCHSTRDWTKFSGPMIPGTEGKGGEKFDASLGFPGVFYSPNITPYAISGWSDAEIYRAITSGVGKEGRPLFPVMPYLYYGTMATEDIYSIIAYIRTLLPVKYAPPASVADFPMNIILHLIPKEAHPTEIPSRSDTVRYGQYLVNAAGCIECHTPVDKGQIIREKAFTGGRQFMLPSGQLATPNLTPDKETGIGNWSAETFVKRFKAYDLSTYDPPVVKKNAFMTIMPWTMYAGMETSDLRSIYAYLHTLKSVHNEVVLFKPIR